MQTLHPPSYSLWQLVRYMLRLGTLGFGGPVALTGYHWLNDRQFVDAVAVAMITPGPVVITAGFIGYLIAGLPGAIVAALATFLPCYASCSLPPFSASPSIP